MLPPPKNAALAARASQAVETLAEAFGPRMIPGDGFMAFSRNASFRGDPEFAEATVRQRGPDALHRLWPRHVLGWALESSMAIEGGAVFFGTARADLEFLGIAQRPFFESREVATLNEGEADPVAFEAFQRGAPRQIALLHLAVLDQSIELDVLEKLNARLQTGAIVVIEEFGRSALAERHGALLQFFRARRIVPLEVGTAQGIVLWP
jgi:hypothetical protein